MVPSSRFKVWLSPAIAFLGLASQVVRAYEVNFAQVESSREICSGMYGGENAHIVLTFDPRSEGQLAVAMYEWSDVEYLGVDNVQLRESDPTRIYICTTEAIQNGLCSPRSLGSFITSIPDNVRVDDTSLMITSVRFGRIGTPDQGADTEIGTPDEYVPEGEEAGGSSDIVSPVDEQAETDQDDQDASDDDDESSEIGGNYPGTDNGDEGDDQSVGSIEDDGRVDDSLGSNADSEWEENQVYDEADGLDQGVSQNDPEYASDASSGGEAEEIIVPEYEPAGLDERGNADRHIQTKGNEGSSTSHKGISEVVTKADVMRSDVNHAPTEIRKGGFRRSARSLQRYRLHERGRSDTIKRSTLSLTKSKIRTRSIESSAEGTLMNRNSRQIVYQVPWTGYYCVGIVPMVSFASKRDAEAYSTYSGTLLFRNSFDGQLRAVDYPRMQFFTAMMCTYIAIAAAWVYASVKHSQGLFLMQWAVTGILGILIVEYSMLQGYYRYLNHQAGAKGATALLIIAVLLNALRNSLSLLLLLLVSKGWGISRIRLDEQLKQIKMLVGCHWIFSVAYAIASICVDMETASRVIVVCLLLPLTVTLGTFLGWIFISLQKTCAGLLTHKQMVKLATFKKLNRILTCSMAATLITVTYSYFVLHSNTGANFPAYTWRTRWVVADGLSSTIYLATFSSIAWLLRPSENSHQLVMSSQISQEDDNEDLDDAEIELDRLHAQQSILAY